MSSRFFSWPLRHRLLVGLQLILLQCLPLAVAPADTAEELFNQGQTWEQFLTTSRTQRTLWLRTTANVSLSEDLVQRFRQISTELRILVVAEDWCPDSVNVVPYVAALASSASVSLRIVGRKIGEPIMNRHRTPDGRPATPTVVLLRHGEDVGAWVERPAVVQQWFLSMATRPENARRFGDRQSWYESDRGQTMLAEFVALAERTTTAR